MAVRATGRAAIHPLGQRPRVHSKQGAGVAVTRGVKTRHIQQGSRWENGHVQSLNGKPRDELLNVEIFDTLFEAQVLIERW